MIVLHIYDIGVTLAQPKLKIKTILGEGLRRQANRGINVLQTKLKLNLH